MQFIHVSSLISSLIEEKKQYDLKVFPNSRHGVQGVQNLTYMEQVCSNIIFAPVYTDTRCMRDLDSSTSTLPCSISTLPCSSALAYCNNQLFTDYVIQHLKPLRA